MKKGIDNIAPQAPELEEAVLGAILIETEAFNIIDEHLTGADFYVKANQVIFETAKKLHQERKPIDMLTVVEELHRENKLEAVGGPVYIAQLADKVGSSAHIEFHSRIIKQKAVERKTIENLYNGIKQIQEGEDIGDVLFHTSKQLEVQQEALVGKQTSLHLSNALSESISNMYERVSLFDQGKQSGINTGLSKLNKATNGWQNSELIIIAARPAMGKTAFLLHFAKVAAKEGIPVALFSLEMSNVSLSDRLILSECNIDADNFKSGQLTMEETEEIEKAVGHLWNLPIYIDDNASVTMDYIRARSRILHKQGKCDMVLIDYLQLASDIGRNQSREQAISQMSRTAKIIAKELDIPVILLSQLNRSVESRADKKPLLSDLRESGAIEQDADKVIFIYRPEYYGIEATDENGALLKNCGQLLIAKNRNGATGIVGFSHNESLTKITDYSSVEEPS